MTDETQRAAPTGEGVDRDTWRTPPHGAWAFSHVGEVLPVATIAAGPGAPFATAPANFDSFSLRAPTGETLDLEGFLAATSTDAMVILHDGRIVFEAYRGAGAADQPHIFMSVTKAMTGLMAGLVGQAGHLDLDEPVTHLVPEVARTGYAHATLRHLLDMRAGVVLTPEESLNYVAAVGGEPEAIGRPATSLHDVLSALGPAKAAHGGPFSYVSANTDLLAWALERAAGKPFAELASDLFWKRLGAEHAASIIVDREGAPWCAGGLSATARDLARIGQMLLNDGRIGERQLLSKAFVDDLRTGGDVEAWKTGEWGASFAFISRAMSYRSGWYAVRSEPHILFAMGTHGQNLFVDHATGVVIAKLSSQGPRIDPRAIWTTHMAVPELTRCLSARQG